MLVGVLRRPGGAGRPVGRVVRGPLQRVGGRCRTVSAWVARGGDVERSALYLGVTRLNAPPFALTLRAPHRRVFGPLYLCVCTRTIRVYSPAALASLHSRYMSAFISGLSSAMVSPTVTNRSMAKFTPWPTLAIALAVLSVQNGRSRCATNVDICNTTYNKILY